MHQLRLRVLKEFLKVKWRRYEEFGYNMLGFMFKNNVSKAVLDAWPNPILKVNGFDDQLKTTRVVVDHMQKNLAQICTHRNMPAMKQIAKKARVGGVVEID
jgi:hypothetical protein